MQREEEAKLEKARNGGAEKAAAQAVPQQREEDAIHPSRRARVPFSRN
jgi:hypothetical protein